MSERIIEIGTAKAAPGEVSRGVIPVTSLAGGGSLEIPLVVIQGARPGPVLWIDGAIHGDEPEGPLCCQILLREVAATALAGTLVLVPVINVPAYEAACRGNPLDTFSHDMNRIYPGRADGYLSERVAHAHATWMTKIADMEISIHSGGSHSFLAPAMFTDERPESVELGTAMGPGWGCMMSSPNPKGNPMAAMAAAGKVGITVEYGGRSATSPARRRHPECAAPLQDAARHSPLRERPHQGHAGGAVGAGLRPVPARARCRVPDAHAQGRRDRPHRQPVR
jgi:predicted deacylase